MQVANDVASAKKLPSCEARPARQQLRLREAAGRERIASGALERSHWLRARRSWREASRRPWRLERRDAGKLRCEGLGGKAQHCICYLGVCLQWRVQPVHRGEKEATANNMNDVSALHAALRQQHFRQPRILSVRLPCSGAVQPHAAPFFWGPDCVRPAVGRRHFLLRWAPR